MTVVTHDGSAERVPVARTFSTVDLPDERRIELWEDHNASALVGLRCRTVDARPLWAVETNVQMSRLHLARVKGVAHVVERNGSVIDGSPAEAVLVYITLRGTAVLRHETGVIALRPGQLVAYDVDRPFERVFAHGLEELAVKVPRELFHELGGGVLRTPLVADFADGATCHARTLAELVARAVRTTDRVPADEGTVLELLSLLVLGDSAEPMLAHRATARSYIETHLTDPGLTASRVAGAIGISERHLGRVFASDGTSIPRHILHRRLDLAHALLTDGWEHCGGVAAVAASSGFTSATYFSHSFRERFGLRAGEVLREARSAHLA